METVRGITEGRQCRQLVPRERDIIEALPIAGGTLAPLQAPLAVAVIGGSLPAGLQNVVLAADPAGADLIWDPAREWC